MLDTKSHASQVKFFSAFIDNIFSCLSHACVWLSALLDITTFSILLNWDYFFLMMSLLF